MTLSVLDAVCLCLPCITYAADVCWTQQRSKKGAKIFQKQYSYGRHLSPKAIEKQPKASQHFSNTRDPDPSDNNVRLFQYIARHIVHQNNLEASTIQYLDQDTLQMPKLYRSARLYLVNRCYHAPHLYIHDAEQHSQTINSSELARPEGDLRCSVYIKNLSQNNKKTDKPICARVKGSLV